MVERNQKVLLRKVDIVDWDSPAARQAHAEFGLEGIPHVRIFDSQGKLVEDVAGMNPEAVERAVTKALRP